MNCQWKNYINSNQNRMRDSNIEMTGGANGVVVAEQTVAQQITSFIICICVCLSCSLCCFLLFLGLQSVMKNQNIMPNQNFMSNLNRSPY